MTFTRLSDAATLEPQMTLGPYETEQESRTIVRELLASSAVRITYVPPATRTGSYVLQFGTHADAQAARVWFSARSEYEISGQASSGTGPFEWVGGYYLPVDPEELDESYVTRFTVTGGGLRIEQDTDLGLWYLQVPYKETPL